MPINNSTKLLVVQLTPLKDTKKWISVSELAQHKLSLTLKLQVDFMPILSHISPIQRKITNHFIASKMEGLKPVTLKFH